ncbi:MAG: thiolase family protein [Candidatus Hydrothermia bacterium]|jgi:acetyl-CoA C-acetyltransferase|nr:thiolase family protein [Candidatus Hydrothermia bacterium]
MRVAIVSAVRTPIGKILGNLSKFKAVELGAIVIREATKRANIEPEIIDLVIMGQVLQGGNGQNPARQSAILGGIKSNIPAFTINMVCGSGLKAIMLGAQAIKSGDADIVVAGGMESMTNTPHAVYLRNGIKYGNVEMIDLMIYDGLSCQFNNNVHMGHLAEYTAEKANITREEMDQLAYESHKKAIRAIDNGYFKDEIVPIEVDGKIIDTDETPRRDTSLEKLLSLKPAFKKDGKVTAGNAPPLSDGASAVILVSERKLKELNLKPLAWILDYTEYFTEPKDLFFAPIGAFKKLMNKLNIKDINEFDLIELNEAFASQVLADYKELMWDWDKFNINGGAIALGHPIGASGARILTTLIYSLRRLNKKIGIAGLCLGGGGSVAMAISTDT